MAKSHVRAVSRTMTAGSKCAAVATIVCLTAFTAVRATLAADVTFNITKISESDPVPGSGSQFYADVWGDGIYAYVGSDVNGGGIAIFDISNPAVPDYIGMYPGNQMEDVEVHNNIGYFSSDVNTRGSSSRTGVDIVNVANPFSPTLLSRIGPANFPQAHGKVHTISISNGFLYTTDNETYNSAFNSDPTDYVKVWNIANPSSPQFVANIDLGLPNNIPSHEATAIGNRLYVASKDNNNDFGDGWTHIYDVSNIATTGPKLLKAWQTGARTHTSTATPDGKLMVMAEERQQGVVKIYDISNINPNPSPAEIVAPIAPLATISKPSADAHSPHHPHIHGDLLFITWYEAGLQVYNIANPANPILVGAYDSYAGTSTNYNGAWGAYHLLGYDKLLLSDRTRGLIVLDARGVEPNPDFNLDFKVDGPDFLTWQRGFGKTSAATLAQGDGNRDGSIGAPDYSLWERFYGDANHQHYVAAVPEGSTLSLGLAAAMFVYSRSRTRSPWRR